ncbi:conserved Plasmodium protein, unknown function [Plasmodium vinckei lentum]|uniref:Uncharacterized protein n=1 Tax=Plasmodium vinckei lentum TaxID=138297 RepID=A0A6V7SP20_PLAVN|nr:conserved Plasmodium protein, unknown function [Plasmodium vinckei lentum]
MFNVFSAAFIDNKNNNLNKPINNSISNNILGRSISGNANNENDKTKNVPLKDRLATVRNAQNILNKKNLNKTDDNNDNKDGTNNEEKNDNENNTNLGTNTENDTNKITLNNDKGLSKFKNYSSVVNEKKNEELEKKLKKRKRRKKHVIIMERLRKKDKHHISEEDDEYDDEDNNSAKDDGYNRQSNKSDQQFNDGKEDESGDENGDYENEKNFSKNFYNLGRSTVNNNSGVLGKYSFNNMNSTGNNAMGMKPKRKRRKKKEMEEYRARLMREKMQQQNSLSSILTKTNSFNSTNENNNEQNAHGEIKIKRRRGRPKLSEALRNNNDKSKQNDIRKYCSRNSENQFMGKDSNMSEKNKGEGNDENKNVFKIIKTSGQENATFMKRSPMEIIELERSYKNNIKKGVTCIPLNYQSKGGGMAIILIGTETTYGPVKNSYGFMTFLVLDCHLNKFFIDTGIKNNVTECEKHMQLLISPGDMYMFKNQSQEVEARLLLIVCNKMNCPFDAKAHIKDPGFNTNK